MNVEAYNVDTLRALVRNLQSENRRLREFLYDKGIDFQDSGDFHILSKMPDEYDPDQGARIVPFEINEMVANRFLGRFWGRMDVYAKRSAKGGYYPQCSNRWKPYCPKQTDLKSPCDHCQHQSWMPLTKSCIMNHLRGAKEDGSDAIGVYPLLPNDNTCRFLVFDFDNHEKGASNTDFSNEDDAWKDEVSALRKICKNNNIPVLVERSRSGKGAHVWIFFRHRIPAVLARNFGLTLLDKGAMSINLTTFRFYDRMYPSQDVANRLGNLIALPLQGQPLRIGNSAFVDENWNAYPDQLKVLFHTPALTIQQVQEAITRWTIELTGQPCYNPFLLTQERQKPWKRDDRFHSSDVSGTFHMVLANGVYVDALNLGAGLQNHIRCLATIDNPKYFQNLQKGRSNYYQFSTISLASDKEGYIHVPRGLFEKITQKCIESGIAYDVEDRREMGCPIRVSFHGTLRPQQQIAADSILQHETGILSSATGSGKTVLCSYLIAQRKVNTLILVNKIDLVEQWKERLEQFLVIDEPLPVYQTPGGKTKQRDSVIGVLAGGSDKTGGIIDIAMIGSAYKQGVFFDRIRSYGMVIMDECHHAASTQAQAILKEIPSKYVYGVSATLRRSDKLDKINHMLLGPLRHEYTAKEYAQSQGIGQYVRFRFTRFVNFQIKEVLPGMVMEEKASKQFHKLQEAQSYQSLMEQLCLNPDRNQMIIRDVIHCIENNRSPVLLTGRKKHALLLYELLKDKADQVFLLYGGQTEKANRDARKAMMDIGRNHSMIVIATGQKIGEGFDFPRLDTLILATPIKFDGLLTQYVGRLSRQYPGKQDAVIYDYVDSHIGIFDNQYRSRLRTYKRLGYRVQSENVTNNFITNAIYDKNNYLEAFERDLAFAEQEIVISSRDILKHKAIRMMKIVKPRIESGIRVTIITMDPDSILFGDASDHIGMLRELANIGITVITRNDDLPCFAVLDQKLVWHGGLNLLGKEDIWDNLIRVESPQAAMELLEMAYQKS